MDEEGGGDQGGGGAAAGDQGGGEAGQAQGWNYAEGVAGTGDRPDWFKEKYSSVDAQAKAYGDLESRFGGFTGAPDEYAMPDGYATEGEAAILSASLKEIAKDSNMNQDTYNKILESVTTNIEGYRESMQQDSMEAAIKSIPNFDNRRTALADTAQTVLTTDQFAGMNDLLQTVEGFEAVEALTAAVRGHALPGSQQRAEQRSSADIMQEINNLDASDMNGRNKLIAEMNKNGGGQGTLV